MGKFNKDTGIADITGVFNTVKRIASAHIGVASFDWGEFQFDYNTTNLYPVFFLELPFSIREIQTAEIYHFAFQLADQMDPGMEKDQTIVLLSKCKAIASEIVVALGQVFISVESEVNYLTFTSEGNDGICGVRAELTIKTKRNVAPCDDVFRAIS